MKVVRLEMKKFGELSSEALEDTIRRLLGEAVSDLVYRAMGKSVLLKREKVDEKIDAFHACLEKMFGCQAAQILQATSLKDLRLKLQREYEDVEKYFSILDALYEIKFRLLAPSSFKEHERSTCD